MKNKKGIIIGGVAFLVLILAITTWNQRNHAVKLKNKVNAQYSTNQSEYDNMWKKFKELTQVTDLQAEQFKDAYTGLITGRYQDTGLLMKSVKEQNPNLDSSVYIKLQTEISASRNSFNNNQKKVIDMVREYNDYVETKPLMIMIGRHKLKDSNYFITSAKTQDAFKSKQDDQINLTDKK